MVTLVGVVASYVGVQYLLGPDLSLPDTLAGIERLTVAESTRFERYMADEGDRYGTDAEGGVYGAPLASEFFAVLVDLHGREHGSAVRRAGPRVLAGGRVRGRNGGTERHEARE